MNNNNLHLDWIDSVRGFAVLFVLAYHCLFWPFKATHIPWKAGFRDFDQSLDFIILTPFTFGWSGVAIFFVISGFCIHLSFSRNPSYKNFFWKRLWRIVPPYLCCLVLFFIGDLATGQFESRKDAAFQFFSHLFLVQNLWQETHFGINPSFWSIAVETQIYLIYPFFWFLQRNLGWTKALGTAFLVEMICIMSSFYSELYYFNISRLLLNGPFAYWFSWSLGAYLAQSSLEQRDDFWPKIAHPVALSALVLAAWLYQPLTHFSFLLVSLLTASLMARRLNRRSPKEDRRKPILSTIGIISYSLYLLHQPIISLVYKLLSKLDFYRHSSLLMQYSGLFVISTIVAIFASFVFYRTIERPSVLIGNKIGEFLAKL